MPGEEAAVVHDKEQPPVRRRHEASAMLARHIGGHRFAAARHKPNGNVREVRRDNDNPGNGLDRVRVQGSAKEGRCARRVRVVRGPLTVMGSRGARERGGETKGGGNEGGGNEGGGKLGADGSHPPAGSSLAGGFGPPEATSAGTADRAGAFPVGALPGTGTAVLAC